jgi:hypothetical protein
MATTTPNFGWPVPTSTDLVKDGATAMEALGDAIDTSMVDLKGGTTGQVLAKASGTDMDFSWVAQDDSNAIQNSIVDAKGDLISATGSDVPARLAVGNNGETLVADSSTSTGLRYQAPVQQNPVINSAFQVWQRSTSAALGSAGVVTSADRWATYTGNNGTMSRQATSDTTNLPNIQYCARIQRNSGETSVAQLLVGTSFETINSIPFAGKTVTLSFYGRAGANYSAAAGAFLATVKTGTGTDQNLVLTGYTGSATPLSTTATLTTTWQRFTVTGTIATTATELGIEFRWTPVGTAGANDYAEITGVQLEIGSVATPFKTYAATIQGERAACERYYWRVTPGIANGMTSPYGYAYSSTVAVGNFSLPVTMRIAPTSMDTANLSFSRFDDTAYAMTGLTLQGTLTTPSAVSFYGTVSGATAGQAGKIITTSTTGYIGFSAEL